MLLFITAQLLIIIVSRLTKAVHWLGSAVFHALCAQYSHTLSVIASFENIFIFFRDHFYGRIKSKARESPREWVSEWEKAESFNAIIIITNHYLVSVQKNLLIASQSPFFLFLNVNCEAISFFSLPNRSSSNKER